MKAKKYCAGLARDIDATRMTKRGDLLGTIRYMSPEQLLANRTDIDHRSDIYSFGVSLYEALTLDLPYEGDSEEAFIGAVSTKDPIPARSRNPDIPLDIETILMKCLERDPDKRYSSAEELKEDLIRYLDDRPVLARRPGFFQKSTRFIKRHRKGKTYRIPDEGLGWRLDNNPGIETVYMVGTTRSLGFGARYDFSHIENRLTKIKTSARGGDAGMVSLDYLSDHTKREELVYGLLTKDFGVVHQYNFLHK
ncbi:serine/threonine protein kinase [Acidobacteriota bacterium]